MVGPRYEHLDFIRGIAAMLVVIEHIRGLLFVSYENVANANPAIAGIYFGTTLGNQAVMVFFALSGFLVGGSAISAYQNQTWSWTSYLLRRLTRLWIVIIPALFFTFAFDSIGAQFASSAYDGDYSAVYPALAPSGDQQHGLISLLGNFFHTQMIFVEPYGTNYPLWSLSYEFWYYILFPLGLGIVFSRDNRLFNIVAALVIVAVLYVYNVNLLILFSIWLAGAFAKYLSKNTSLQRLFANPALLIVSLLLVLGSLVATEFGPDALKPTTSKILGLAVAISLPFLVHTGSLGRSYTKFSRAISEISYSLYLTHLPLITLLAMMAFAPNRFQPNVTGFAWFAAFFAISIIWATIIWYLCERHTDKLYAAFHTRLSSPERKTV